MQLKITIIVSVLVFVLSACEQKNWDDYYHDQPETVDQNVWDAIQANGDLSQFAGFIKEFHYDTLFNEDDPYTLFIPSNAALTQLLDTGSMTKSILDYHISRHFIQSMNVSGIKKIQTFAEKFALFERAGNRVYLDGVEMIFESPLYRNGKFFILDRVAIPKPNLYQFYAINNPVLKDYIDSQDSIILDREKSRPLGFDDDGNTIYDSVIIEFNEFEDEFFPVSEEFRYKTATIVFPLEEDYNAALDGMALTLGEVYQDHTDIPLAWQNEILIPYLLEHGVFENMLEEYEFIPHPSLDTLKMKNILGDSVVIEYSPADKELCSNGYAYNYLDFQIPDTLFTSPSRFEGEWLLFNQGANKFSWDETGDYQVSVISDASFPPLRELVPAASNDSTLRVLFDQGYEGNFSLEFNVDNLFPRRYLMIVRTHMYVGGIYDIYVNDEYAKTVDYYDYVRNREIWWSDYQGLYKPKGAYNSFDLWIENKLGYGETKIRFDYMGPGGVNTNGLVIDYIDFVPFDD